MNGLDRDLEGWDRELIEEDLHHILSVGLWVIWSIDEVDWLLSWVNSELVEVAVVPDLGHVIPALDLTAGNWVREGQKSLLVVGICSDVDVFSVRSNQLSMSWSSDHGWEAGSWSIISSDTCFTHT